MPLWFQQAIAGGNVWWLWLLAGLLLMAGEIFVSGMVIFWFGVGAVAVSLLLLLVDLTLTWQLLVWLLFSLLSLAAWFVHYKPMMHKTRIGLSSAGVVGEVGLLVSAVAEFDKGQVRFQKPLLGSEVWECFADESIAAGERVRVLEIAGNMFKVGRV